MAGSRGDNVDDEFLDVKPRLHETIVQAVQGVQSIGVTRLLHQMLKEMLNKASLGLAVGRCVLGHISRPVDRNAFPIDRLVNALNLNGPILLFETETPHRIESLQTKA